MSAPTTPAAKTERLLNLVLVLLYTRRPLAKAQIRDLVPQYGEAPSIDAFDRMFERDKDELRELGVPLVTQDLDVIHDDEQGYRIDQREYALPDIEFEPDELAVLGLASRSWAHASLGGPAAQALRKLRAAGVERDDGSLIGIEPRLRTNEPAFDAIKDAVVSKTVVTFDYVRSDRSADAGRVQRRTVQPWSLVQWHGRWYLAGFDLDRDATRVFRLSRIRGRVATQGKPDAFEVPADHEARVLVARSDPQEQPQEAQVLVRPGAAHSLRRRALECTDGAAGWTQITVQFTDFSDFAAEFAGHAEQVQVKAPKALADQVSANLTAALTAHQGGESNG